MDPEDVEHEDVEDEDVVTILNGTNLFFSMVKMFANLFLVSILFLSILNVMRWKLFLDLILVRLARNLW